MILSFVGFTFVIWECEISSPPKDAARENSTHYSRQKIFRFLLVNFARSKKCVVENQRRNEIFHFLGNYCVFLHFLKVQEFTQKIILVKRVFVTKYLYPDFCRV